MHHVVMHPLLGLNPTRTAFEEREAQADAIGREMTGPSNRSHLSIFNSDHQLRNHHSADSVSHHHRGRVLTNYDLECQLHQYALVYCSSNGKKYIHQMQAKLLLPGGKHVLSRGEHDKEQSDVDGDDDKQYKRGTFFQGRTLEFL